MAEHDPFHIGDIIESAGETYQVLALDATDGRIIPFPSEETAGERIARQRLEADYRRIGSAPLPAPSPCAAGNGCPFNGRPVPVQFFARDKVAG